MNQVVKVVGVIAFFLCPSLMFAQSANSWTVYQDLPAVKIDYTTQQCGSDVITEFNFIRLTNKTSNSISVSFKVEYYYNGSCTTCGTNEYQFTFDLPANGFLMPSCDDLTTPNGRLAIIKRYVNRNFGHPLDRFELTNIIVQ